MCFRYGATETVARRNSQQGMLKWVFLLLLVGSIFASVFLVGCSGGSSKGTPGTPSTPTPTPTATAAPAVTVKASIFWGARTRAFGATGSGQTIGPSSALSAVITLTSKTGGAALTFTANRDTTSLASYTGTYTLGSSFAGQTYALHVDFYAQANAAGSLVATADSILGGASVTTSGTLSVLITTTGIIQSVKVLGVGTSSAPASTINVGQSLDVIYSAFDGSGNVVAVTPGSEVVSAETGVTAATVGANDQIVGASPSSSAAIYVRVDSVQSPDFSLQVKSVNVFLALAAQNPPSGTATAPIASPGFPLTFVAAVLGDPTSSGVTYALSSTGFGTLGTATTVPSTTTANQTLTTVVFTPSTTVTTGTVTLTATSVYDPNITSSVTITLKSLVGITVTETLNGLQVPVTAGSTVNVSISQAYQFTALVNFVPTGSDTSVTWTTTATAAGGSIDSTGLFTAPPTAGTYTITATSNFDTTKTFTFSVNVQSGTLPITVN